jgi:chromosome segregation ATPase
MERLQATLSNLRADREEILAKIQKFEEERILQSRQNLSLRAELDERKIELLIIRKKLNEEISELKDRLKLQDERRLILEEKNRVLVQELEKVAQRNKIDVKKVQFRERELEQKLELLKSDAETQIRHRDQKILELKRKIDSMEFDMESISQQEKRTVESRFELEDKLEKAIKTLRSAINVLEDEPERVDALKALKKNIDM